MLRSICQCLIDIAFIHQLAGRRRVAPDGLFNIGHIRHAWPRLPHHVQFTHGLLGIFFALGHDADKIALHHHRTDARHMRNRLRVHALQSSTNEVTAVSACIRRTHHTAVQHARHTHVMHKHQFAKHLGRYVHPWQALARDGMVLQWLQWRVDIQRQFQIQTRQQISPRHSAFCIGLYAFRAQAQLLHRFAPEVRCLLQQPLRGLRGSGSQRGCMHLQRGAGNRGALVGRHIGHAHEQMHPRR